MKNYKLMNNLLGWITFAIAAVVYLMTIEPTASFWDCGEFISSAYKLEVGHPPGAPFFMITGRIFASLASDPSQVAFMVNSMSAIFSALTILFLFWSITHLAKAVIVNKDNKESMTLSQMIMILGSGMVGALVYTFSDTFWFSAVEGEVYAYSSLFTAAVFWLILKWEEHADEPHSDRWIVLIAYLMGLSIGVHLLNLLCIPAIVLVYYYKRNPNANLKGSVIALLGSFVLVAILMYGMIPGFVKVAGWFELFCVNTLSLPYNSGVIVYFIVLIATLVWGIYESVQQKNEVRMKIAFILAVALMGIPFIGSGGLKSFGIGMLVLAALSSYIFLKKSISIRLVNNILMCMTVILIGYSSYALIVIRSAANTPMDQNSPEDIFTLGSYLNREQYGDRPLFYGETFASEVARDKNCQAEFKEGAPIYARVAKKDSTEKDQYIVTGHKRNYEYIDQTKMLFPRMYSSQESHVGSYKDWSDFKGKPVRIDRCGEQSMVQMPTFMENMKFFFRYQLNFMYWRYFLWNFAGRQNDIQGHGEISNGNWMTGINFIDKYIVGDQTLLPDDMRNNKGRNVYYMLPLLLGVFGILFQAYRGNKGIQGFWITFFLFFMTGIAIVIYLNQTPYQPRERDYAYAGSFYAFSIWIGLGVAAIANFLSKYMNPTAAASLATAACLCVPVQMAAQNWDDHDRSGRYTARDFGMNYLTSVEPDGIIFTNGDNDTFPLWYAQEVEGYRTDVRVCNLSYLQTDWYIDQMKRQAYESKPLPISFDKTQYIQGTRDVVYLMDMLNGDTLDLNTAMDIVKSEDERFKKIPGYDGRMDFIPAQKFSLKVDKDAVIKSNTVAADYEDSIPSEMIFDLKGKNYLGKQELMILDMIRENNWERPMYYAVTVGSDQQIRMKDNFSLEGLSYRITPVTEKGGMVNTEVMFDNMVNKFKWGGIDNPKVYLDENNLRMVKTFRYMFTELVNALIAEGKTEKALQALDHAMKVMPPATIPNDYSTLSFAEQYYALGQNKKGNEILGDILKNASQYLQWYYSLTPNQTRYSSREIGHQLAVMQAALEIADKDDKALSDQYLPIFSRYAQAWQSGKGGGQ
ncbi:MAG: glycosyltransferase family 117 protein [Bacteroidales bacterium]